MHVTDTCPLLGECIMTQGTDGYHYVLHRLRVRIFHSNVDNARVIINYVRTVCWDGYHLTKNYVTLFVVLTIPVLQGHDPHQTWTKTGPQATAMKTCESRSQKQVQHYRETRSSSDGDLSDAWTLEIRSGRHAHALGNGSLEMRRDCLAKWEVWHLQQVMMSLRWRKSLQSVGFLALYVE